VLSRAIAVGIDPEWAKVVLQKDDDTLQTAITGVNRGLPVIAVEALHRIEPLLLELVVAVLTKKQSAAPLGMLSAMVTSGNMDTLGERARRALEDAIAIVRD